MHSRSRLLPALICIFLQCRETFALSFYNATVDQNHVVCLYTLSGQYAILQRLNYYLVLAFAVLAHRKEWLVGGAFAAVMTSAGIAAVHAVVLAGISRTHIQAFDADTVGLWCLLSPAVILFNPMMRWSFALRNSSARPILRAWGVLVVTGAVCAFVTLTRTYTDSPPCVNPTTGEIIISPTQYTPGQLNCTYPCFTTHQPLRSPSDVVISPKSRVFGRVYAVVFGSSIPTMFMAFVTLLTCLQNDNLDPRQLHDRTKMRIDKSVLKSSYVGITHSAKMAYQRNRRAMCVDYMATVFCPPLLVLTIVANETYLWFSPRIPVSEAPYAVGQWGTWVATALVLIAAVIDRQTGGSGETGKTNGQSGQKIASTDKLGNRMALNTSTIEGISS